MVPFRGSYFAESYCIAHNQITQTHSPCDTRTHARTSNTDQIYSNIPTNKFNHSTQPTNHPTFYKASQKHGALGMVPGDPGDDGCVFDLMCFSTNLQIFLFDSYHLPLHSCGITCRWSTNRMQARAFTPTFWSFCTNQSPSTSFTMHKPLFTCFHTATHAPLAWPRACTRRGTRADSSRRPTRSASQEALEARLYLLYYS